MKKKFAFQSSVWRACRFQCFELQTSWRQSADIKFFHLLNELREGSPPRWVLEVLRSRVCKQADKRNKSALTTTRLCTHRRDTDKFNEHFLNSLPGRHTYWTLILLYLNGYKRKLIELDGDCNAPAAASFP